MCILWLLILCLYGTLLSVRACVSGSLYVSCAVSLAVFLLSALSFSELFVFVLSYFFCYSLDACLLSGKTQKECGSEWEGS